MKRVNLHLGCGPIHLKSTADYDWINIDIEESHHPDITMDYLKICDVFGENQINNIASVHSIEHLEWPLGVQKFFEQTKKALKLCGTMRIVVPDMMKVARKYVAGESLRDIYDGPYWTYKDLPATRLMWFCRGWEHTIVFDEELLKSLSEDAGFKNFRVMPFGVSQVPELRNIDRFESESICVEMDA